MDLHLAGLRVLVTAGATGIGLATAEAFLREGARVHVCDIDETGLEQLRDRMSAKGRSRARISPEARSAEGNPVNAKGRSRARISPEARSAAGNPVSTTVCDVSDPRAVARLFDDAQAALGGLDALVNNAGIAGPTAPCEDIALADWERTLAVNMTGQFLCAQRAIPLLKSSANASIANLSSAAGRFGFPNRAPYAASKWGVIGLTKTLSMELGRFGIRVNAICPGPVAGERIERVFAGKAALRNVPPDVVRDEMLGHTSLRRLVSADDVANAIVFLASAAGANISGHAMPVDADTQALA